MARFALVVTLVELCLTAGTVLWIRAAEPVGDFLSQRDLEMLGIPPSDFKSSASRQGDVLVQDTRASLQNPTQSLHVSFRPGTSVGDFEFRQGREDTLTRRPDRGQTLLTPEPNEGERGYAVRHEGPKSMRFELVRLREGDLLIVRVGRDAPFPEGSSQAMSGCEKRARLVQEHLMSRLRWRD